MSSPKIPVQSSERLPDAQRVERQQRKVRWAEIIDLYNSYRIGSISHLKALSSEKARYFAVFGAIARPLSGKMGYP
ncbi:MAG: hypothetical protein ABSG31_14270, partial [Tepidisphaeraceae bacterium]